MNTADVRQKYARYALILSVISVFLLLSTVYLGLMCAGVALILAVLTLDKDGQGLHQTKIAMSVSAFVIGAGLMMIAYVFFRVILPALNSPDALAALDQFFLENAGFTLSEILEQYNGN